MNRIVLALSWLFFVNGSSSPNSGAKIEEYKNENDGNGNYFFRFVTSDGITRQERGHLNNAGQQTEHMVVKGYYSYTDTDGQIRIIYYTADENGFSIQSPVLSATSVSGPLIASLLGK